VPGLISDLLGQAGHGPDALTLVAFDEGPGAFTGLRVGCGIAQGLGYALGIPVAPVASLAAIASQAAVGAHVLVATDARMGEVYAAIYRHVGRDLIVELERPVVLSPQAAVDWFRARRTPVAGDTAWIAAGNGFAAFPELGRWASDEGHAMRADLGPTAEAVAALGEKRWRQGLAIPASAAAPTYVRDRVALDRDEQAALRLRRQR
jgi:tRNA threonylcarbamoyladenosine biosynthesis protein TsaB